jgi:hypothetical protein
MASMVVFIEGERRGNRRGEGGGESRFGWPGDAREARQTTEGGAARRGRRAGRPVSGGQGASGAVAWARVASWLCSYWEGRREGPGGAHA